MKTVTVIPIAKGIGKEHLTYFSAKDIPVGALVSVPVRSKMVDALVVEVADVEASKSEIKDASYQLKKIEKIKGASIFSEIFLRTVDAARHYYLTQTGTIIEAVVPKILMTNAATATTSSLAARVLTHSMAGARPTRSSAAGPPTRSMATAATTITCKGLRLLQISFREQRAITAETASAYRLLGRSRRKPSARSTRNSGTPSERPPRS